jgi:large subunit ribosomal protein L22
MPVKAIARLRYVSIPPRKMRLVADMVKGLPVEKALDVLNFTPRIAAHHIAKTLKSATANALSQEGTTQLKPESLHVKTITVDSAPMAKRIQFQSMGRVFRIRKRHCHLTIVLEEMAETAGAKVTGKTKAGAGATTAKTTAAKPPAKKTAKKKPGADKASAARSGQKKSTTGKTDKKKVTSRKTSAEAPKGRKKAD